MPDAGILATVMLLVGLFLLGLEFFVPSFGMILVMATLSLIVSFWSACKAWWGVSPYFFWTYIIMLTAGIPGSLMGAIALIQRTSLGNRIILSPGPQSEPAGSELAELIGKRGVSQSLMTPGGIVLVEETRLHAESIGMVIEPNTPVIVVATKASRVVVRPLTAADLAVPQTAQPEGHSTISEKTVDREERPGAVQEPNPLDFDIPEDYTRKS